MDKDNEEIRATALEVIHDALGKQFASTMKLLDPEPFADKLVSQLLCSHELGRGAYCTKCGKFPYYGETQR